MLHSYLPTVQHSRITQLVLTVGLVLAILATTVAGASRVWAEPPVTTQALIQGNAIILETAANSGGRLYAITVGGLYFSTNGGVDWKEQAALALPLYPASLASDPDDPLIVYLGTNYDSLFKSVDGGIIFLRSSTGLGAGSQVAVTAIVLPTPHPGLLMVATGYWVGTGQRNLVPQGLYLSTNGGLSWFQVSDALGETAITDLALDATMVVTARSADGSIQRIPLDTVLSALMQYGTAEEKRQAPVALALLGIQAGEMELTRRFWSGEDLQATIAGLALLGTPDAIQTLVRALGGTEMTSRQHMAMQALESLGEKAVPALITALSDDSSMLRGNAAEMLGWIGSASARPALEHALADEDLAVRLSAAWALSEIR